MELQVCALMIAGVPVAGVSIALGYAPLQNPSGQQLSVIDVPGHERYRWNGREISGERPR